MIAIAQEHADICMLLYNNIIYTFIHIYTCSDAFNIQEGIGVKLSLFITWMSAFLTSVILGFIIDWRMSLVVLGFVPLIVVAAAAGAQVYMHKCS